MHLVPKFSCFGGFLLKKSRTLFIHSPVHYFPNCQMPDDPAGMTAFPRRSGTRSMSWKIPCWHTAPLRRRDQMDLDASLCLHLQFCLFLLLIGIPGRQHCRSQPFCYCFIGTPVLHLIHKYKRVRGIPMVPGRTGPPRTAHPQSSPASAPGLHLQEPVSPSPGTHPAAYGP